MRTVTEKRSSFIYILRVLESLFWIVVSWALSHLLDRALDQFKKIKPPFNKEHLLRILKRILELTLASISLIISFPTFIVLSVIIKATSRGPIFCGQRVIGQEGRIFTIYTFRTTKTTLTGRIMRKLSLHALPMLINVLKGDMTFVGPRPFVIR